MKNKLLLISMMVILVIGTFGIAWADSTNELGASSSEASTDCYATFTYGAGPTFFKWCASEHGNLMKLEAPAGFEHVQVGGWAEGYEICSNGISNGYDFGMTEAAGWIPVSITEPNGPNTLPLTIIRKTPDGKFLLTMTFAQSTSARSVSFTMKVQNISGVTQSNVQITRFTDGDMDNTFGDDILLNTADSVIAYQIHGQALTADTFATPHTTTIGTSSFPIGCKLAPVVTPTPAGDWGGLVTYNLGTLKNNASKSVKFTYKML